MKYLIIGYGRAGKRHIKHLEEHFNVSRDDIVIVEPNDVAVEYRQFYDIETAFSRPKFKYDYAIVCTPPDDHIDHIWMCIAHGIPVLCEKPLCGLGQIARAEELPGNAKIMVAYNYRYNKGLRDLKSNRAFVHNYMGWYMLSVQHRPKLPVWGLLLDHVSHDIDIMRVLLERIEIDESTYSNSTQYEQWTVSGKVPSGKQFVIAERVSKMQIDRRCTIRYGVSEATIDAPVEMYTDMLDAFLHGNYYPGLRDALETQRLLERTNQVVTELFTDVGEGNNNGEKL